jgi:hypothetical protein
VNCEITNFHFEKSGELQPEQVAHGAKMSMQQLLQLLDLKSRSQPSVWFEYSLETDSCLVISQAKAWQRQAPLSDWIPNPSKCLSPDVVWFDLAPFLSDPSDERVNGTIDPTRGDLGDFGIGHASANERRQIMSPVMLFVHSITCGRMHARKACDDQRPMSTILSIEWFSRNKPMAAPDRMDLVPMSVESNPNDFLHRELSKGGAIGFGGIRWRTGASQGRPG